MAFFTIIKYVLAAFVGFFIFIAAGPMMYMMRYENPMWHDMPTDMLAFGDMTYGIWVLFIVIIIGVIVIAGINEANKNRAIDQS